VLCFCCCLSSLSRPLSHVPPHLSYTASYLYPAQFHLPLPGDRRRNDSPRPLPFDSVLLLLPLRCRSANSPLQPRYTPAAVRRHPFWLDGLRLLHKPLAIRTPALEAARLPESQLLLTLPSSAPTSDNPQSTTPRCIHHHHHLRREPHPRFRRFDRRPRFVYSETLAASTPSISSPPVSLARSSRINLNLTSCQLMQNTPR